MSLEDLGSSVGGRRATDTSRDNPLSSADGEETPVSLTSNEEEDESSEGSQVVVAQPPKLSGKDTGVRQLALTGSTALDELDQLLASNQIGKERAAKLRRKFNSLQETLELSRQLESSLLTEAKQLGQQLSQQRRVLEKAESFPEGDGSESGQLRQMLLTQQNELDMTEERIQKLQHDMKLLEEERSQVEKEYNRLPKREELDAHIRDLSRQKDEVNDELTLRSQDAQRYREDLDKKNKRLAVLRQEIDELHSVEEALQTELIEIRNGPNIPKEIDTVKKLQFETKEQIAEQNEQIQQILPQISESEQRLSALISEHKETASELDRQRQTLQESHVHLDRLFKDMNMAKEREATLLEDRATLELRLKHRAGEHRSLYEGVASKNKEKEKELKMLKKATLQLDILKQSLEQVHRQKELLEQRRAVQGEGLEVGRERREELNREVDILRKGLSLTEGEVDGGMVLLDRLSEREQHLKDDIRRLHSILHGCNRDVVAMTKSRDQDAREYYKACREERGLADDLRTKDSQIEDQKKRIRELEKQLSDFATAYEVVKTERNKNHTHTAALQQVKAEFIEKLKILSNETEILRTSAQSKDKILQKCSLVHTAKLLERDTQRSELSKLRHNLMELNFELEGKREEIHKLTQQINTTEQQLNKLRRRYEQSVQERNDLGLQLIERNEEVCVFYERQNIQESLLRKANMELNSREEELRFIKMELSRLDNDVLVNRKLLPEKDKMEQELMNAQIELKECERQMREIEKAVENANDPSRLRLLPGGDPSRNELASKIETLESQLGESEHQLLEKELLFEQVCKLSDRAQQKVEGQKLSTLEVAKKVNYYQTKIKDTTRKMMALVSELSMYQASSLRLGQEMRDRECQLEQAYTRLEAGEAPDEQTVLEWQREERERERRIQDEYIRRKLAEEEESHTLPGGGLSTAEPRPNAYMPSGEGDLPIPKPYGCHAPFKPSQAGSNIRHIRKPHPKPIDI